MRLRACTKTGEADERWGIRNGAAVQAAMRNARQRRDYIMRPRMPIQIALVMFLVMIACVALAACASPMAGQSSTPTGGHVPTPTDTPPPGTFYFTTEDGITLSGELVGAGKTALIFSNGQEVSKSVWQHTAEQLASHGYLCLLYDYRGIEPSQGRDDLERRDQDLRAAVRLARARGATTVVLIGSSFGGTLTLALAAQTQPKAVVILSAPLSVPGFVVSGADLKALTMPKLFMASQGDTRYVGAVQQMYEMSTEPKQLRIFPGANHGDFILAASDTGSNAMQALLAFLQRYAPSI
jgi:alpha/beta superfamily hydrolase